MTAHPFEFATVIETDMHGVKIGRLTSGDNSVRLLLPEDLDETQAMSVLVYWPAWQLTEAACLELGSRVLVIGAGWLARSVLRLCFLRGCLHRTIYGPEGLADEAEQHVPELISLSTPPNAVFVLKDAVHHLSKALSLCTDKGTVVLFDVAPSTVDLDLYPDAHKRGLRITTVPLSGMEMERQDSVHLLARMVRWGKLKEPCDIKQS